MNEQAPATGIIRLTIQGSAMTSNMIVPTCRINGHSVPTRYGVQDLTVWPGPNHIELQAQWMRTYGQAALDVTVDPGQVVPVFYAAPLHQFTTGNIGFTKQKRGGVGCLVATIAVPLVIALLAVLLALATR
ncbi:MAG TPA: hypothetical protein PLX71_08535 [Phycicoccus sp.]|nr:hypothetical protein [Phycicoccus sp.]